MAIRSDGKALAAKVKARTAEEAAKRIAEMAERVQIIS